jgi:hypothetical protein
VTPPTDIPHPFYSEVPRRLSHEVAIGGALITLVEPHPGHEVAYNRWYEDDHFYAGALFMPWMFAGGRFLATRDLQLLRTPQDSFIARPVTAGCFLHLYWIAAGHLADHKAWTFATNRELTAQDRRYAERTHVYTTFADYLGAEYRDAAGPRDIHSLDHRYPGVVLQVVQAGEDTSRGDLDDWLRTRYLPSLTRAGGPVAQTLRFADVPLAEAQVDHRGLAIPHAERRVVLVHFLDDDPRHRWAEHFAGNAAAVESGGLGRLELSAPFIPVEFGTNRFLDELR